MQEAIRLIKRFEGFSPVIYECPAGYPTIGYGHVVLPEEREKFAKGISKEEAELLLEEDLKRFQIALKPFIKTKVHDLMMQAILSFAYNVGIYAFRASTLRRLLNSGDYMGAAEQFLKWVYAGGRRLKGLILRRQAERLLFLEGVKEI